METTSTFWALVFTGILILIVINGIIGLKIKQLLSKEESNKEVYLLLAHLKEKLANIDKEIEDRISKTIMYDLEKTKNSLIEHLNKIKDSIDTTINNLSSENNSLSRETQRTLLDMKKEVNKTIREINREFNNNIIKINLDAKNTIQNISRESINQIKTLSEKLGRLEQKMESIEKISSEIKALQDILKPPKQRGSFGEMLLENLIKDIFPKELYEFQYSIGNSKVDAVLKLNGKVLPIDSKFPLDNYLRVLNEEKSIDTLVRNVKKMIDEISKKYIKPSEYNTTNFAFMYVPSESIWYDLFVMNPSVFKYAVEKRVIPVSPNTLMSYFHIILEGLKAFEIEKTIDSLKDEINSFNQKIEEGINEFDRLERHMRNSLNKVKSVRDILVEINEKINTLGKTTHTKN